jgi:hypothetical protein
MEALRPIFDSDWLPIGILVLIVVEAALIVRYQRRHPEGPLGAPNVPRLLTFLGAGGSLVAAMIFHRRPEPAPALFALAMLAALVIHVWHIRVLFRR